MFNWKILNIFIENGEIRVHYNLKADDGVDSVETEGNHTFNKSVIDVPIEEAREQNIIAWLEKDTAQDDVNLIKLNLEKQLAELKKETKVGLPWLANTFKVQI
jgi:hypothetical protein